MYGIFLYTLLNSNTFLLPWAFIKAGIIPSNIILALSCCLSYYRQSHAYEVKNNFIVICYPIFLFPMLVHIAQNTSLIARHVTYALTKHTNLTFNHSIIALTVGIILIMTPIIFNYYYNSTVDYVILCTSVMIIIFIIISAVTNGYNYSSDLLLPDSPFSFAMGAVIIMRSFLILEGERHIVIFNRKQDKTVSKKFLMFTHSVMLITYAFISNFVSIYAGKKTSDVLFMSFPDSKVNLYFCYVFAAILILNSHQRMSYEYFLHWETYVKFFLRFFCKEMVINENSLVQLSSAMVINSFLMVITFSASLTGLKNGYLQIIGSCSFLIMFIILEFIIDAIDVYRNWENIDNCRRIYVGLCFLWYMVLVLTLLFGFASMVKEMV